jgi:uncharacterized repeat protein (TIGR03803 family)
MHSGTTWTPGGAGAIRKVLPLTILSALLLIVAVTPAQAQTETVLYNFCSQPNCSDGGDIFSGLTSDGAGNFYGTTGFGVQGNGTVFELSPNGSGGYNETVIHAFCSGGGNSCPDGADPYFSNVIFDSQGNLYGTTSAGGAYGFGVAFELSPLAGTWTETVLYSFANNGDGASPGNGLIMDSAGNLYGTNSAGVFELRPSGGNWTEQVIYSVDGAYDRSGLTMDNSGNIFGVTNSTVFEVSPNGQGGWNANVIYSFPGYARDGSSPASAPVLDQAGSLYGTTAAGGSHNYGTVYKLTSGKNGWTEKRLYSFKSPKKDAGAPFAGVVLDQTGNIYGTTLGGGTDDAGAVFELVPPVGKGKYEEKVLWYFNIADGEWPYGTLILDSAGNLYGTTNDGGSGGYGEYGTVFEVTP